METRKILAILAVALGLVLWPGPMARAAQYLTVNNEPVDSTTLVVEQSCTIEVVSDDGAAYLSYWIFPVGFDLGDFTLLQIMPAAGSSASATDYGGAFEISAGGSGITTGVHFVFQYVAQTAGQTDIWLIDDLFLTLDSVNITIKQIGPMSSAFTYQGHLYDNNDVADGLYDFQFKLYNDEGPDSGAQKGSTVTMDDVDIIDAYFTVELDFNDANAFNGDARWLEIGVRPGELSDPCEYTILEPRQELTPAPYAIYAASAGKVEMPIDLTAAGSEPVISSTSTGTGMALYGLHETSGNAGYIGSSGYGVYGYSSSGYGGYFEGDARVTDDLMVDGSYYDSSSSAGTAGQYLSSTGTETVWANVSWNELTNVPGGFADGVDNVGDSDWTISDSNMYSIPSGNVGIGTTSPAAKLEVNGEIKITDGSQGVGKVLTSDASGLANWQTPTVGDSDWTISDGNMYSIPSGNVGIGTTSPEAKLHIAGTPGVDGIKFPDGSIQTTAGVTEVGNIKQLVMNFLVAAGESVTAGDVVGFVDGYVRKWSFDVIIRGPEYEFNPASTVDVSAAALSSTKFVVAYKDEGNSNYGTAVIGDVSGLYISWGSEYVFNTDSTVDVSAAALSSTKFVVSYRDEGNSDYGTAVIGDVSGSTISFGSEYVFYSGSTGLVSAAALSSTKFVVAYKDWEPFHLNPEAIVGDVSGKTITFGPIATINSSTMGYYISVSALSPTKFVVAYSGSDNKGQANICTVSGNTIATGVMNEFNTTSSTSYVSVAALSPDKFVVAYRDEGNSYYGTARIGTVYLENQIYFHPVYTEYVFNPATTRYISAAALSSTKFVVCYRDEGNSNYGTAVIGDVSGYTITYGSEYEFNSGATNYTSAVALTDTFFAVPYTDEGNSYFGSAVIGLVYSGSGMIGIASESKTAGETVSVITAGVSDAHSGLTSGAVYYCTTSGDLSTDVTDYRVGLAISSTEVLLNSDRDNAQFFGDMVFANDFRITEGISYEGLILKNHLNSEILTISEEGNLNINGLSVGPDSLVVDSAAGGNVGIGTTSPQRKLHINDVMRLEPASAPLSPSEGDIYMDGTIHKLMVFDGKNWQACW